MNRERIIKGFIFAPMAPAALYSLLVALSGFAHGGMDVVKWVLVLAAWFAISLPFSYLITLVLGIPLFIVLKKRGLMAFRPSVMASTLLGLLVSLPIAFGLGWSGPLNRIIVIVSSGMFAALAAGVFWWLACRDIEGSSAAELATEEEQ